MEKIDEKHCIVYRHTTSYRGEEIGIRMSQKKNSAGEISIEVYTPVGRENISNSRFYELKVKISNMHKAKEVLTEFITEATTDIDEHLSKVEDLEDFFEFVDESLDSLEDKSKEKRKLREELGELPHSTYTT